MYNNASVSYFNEDNEDECLINIYAKLYDITIDNEYATVLFINLTGDMNTVTIFDLNKNIKYGTYSEYSDYSLTELEEEINMLYKEFYSQYIDFEPMIIIIHDATKMPDCADDYELIEYLNEKLTILRAMQTYVFCTVRDN